MAVNFDCLDVQVRAREDAQKLLGLYRERLELSGPGGGPIPYDDIPQDERELLLAVTKDYERRLNEKNAKRGKKAGRKGRRTRQD